MTDKELMQMALDALIDAADSQNWEMQQNIDQHGEWYRRSVYLKQATTNSQEAIKALSARLSQCERCGEVNPAEIYTCTPKQEPVAWMYEYGTDHGDAVNEIRWYPNVHWKEPTGLVRNVVPLYTAPPQREWQGLTDDEIKEIVGPWGSLPIDGYTRKLFDQIEAKLKEKNAPDL